MDGMDIKKIYYLETRNHFLIIKSKNKSYLDIILIKLLGKKNI